MTTAPPGEGQNQGAALQNPAPAAPRSLVYPANLSQAQEAAEETEAEKTGELVGESQRLTGEPLEVPDYSIDPAQQDVEVFNERVSRSTQVLEFLNSRPAPRSGGGVSIIV